MKYKIEQPGSLLGWLIEVIFRRFFSSNNPKRKWINPGFLVGPYIPLYGLSLVTLLVFSFIPVNFIGMSIKLWDYSGEWGNIKGIICPQR